MTSDKQRPLIAGPDEPVLVTGATGFVGRALVASLFRHGFRNVRILARGSSDVRPLEDMATRQGNGARLTVVRGNLLSKENCASAAKDAVVIFHLARGTDKSFPGAFMNSVVATRNLLEGSLRGSTLRRFVNVSSFAVYSNRGRHRAGVLDESGSVEERPELRGDAYCFAKIKQDAIVTEYGAKRGIPYVIVRPGSVYGPKSRSITGRVGIDTFGVFVHLGGSNRIPFTYVDNCADAIVLAGVTPGIDGEVFNVVDDDLPSSRTFLRLYKQNVRRFRSIYVPHAASYALCWLWEWYSTRSEGQLPIAFNRRRWRAEWRRTRYSNQKLKARLGWRPEVSMTEGMRRYFESCRHA